MSNDNQTDSAAAPAIPGPPPLPAWIEASLFESTFQKIVPDFKQTKVFEAKPALAAGENYATVMLRLEAEVELKDGSSKNISLMLKTAHDSDMFRAMMQSHNIFDVESQVYRDVVPEFEELYKEVGVDVKFGSKSYQLPIEHPYILLEDLCLQGFKNMNRMEGLDMEHTQAVLKKLAQWHAASAVRVANKGNYSPLIKDGYFNENPQNRAMFKAMLDGMSTIFLQCAKSYEGNEEYYEALCEAATNQFENIVKNVAEGPSGFCVLNHGDCWSNNVMFKHDADGKIAETYLIDYQMPRYGTPAQDLYYFLLSSTKYELKLSHFEYFVKFYHDELVKHLKVLNYSKKLPTLKELHIMLLQHSIWAYSTITGVMGAVLLDPNENASAENFMAETDVGQLFKFQLYSNPRYRKHMEMILPWLYNRGAF